MSKMNVLITAGGTAEAIDAVRSITNYSTGQLGRTIAERFAKEGASITYICGQNAALPAIKDINIIPIKNVQELAEAIEAQLDNHKYDCVIHSMAVSDYTPNAVLTLEDIAEKIANNYTISTTNGVGAASCRPQTSTHNKDNGQIQLNKDSISNAIKQALQPPIKPLTKTKLSSKAQDLIIHLKQTPKVIQLIKSKQPETILVGFKLLSNATEAQLLQAANEVLTKNACDLVIANDLQNINSNTHKAILINKSGQTHTANTKQEIAEIILASVSERMKNQ